ncbi:cysteine-rich receptor-like protein kinase 44 isoform X1 [Daucus carota subsp. sativus]|nr:PREDICTED: putative receptor-like protein kinase At4g00960 isoform X1 [Daucus carota subsp. sativus]XP_017231605.1 PREDICTED: putative receptor-like protein kinase At4g00960 isoform X1 [Daucus carota subsp. sativus]
MKFSIPFLYLAINVIGITFGQPPDFIYYSCGSDAGDSTYMTNLNNVLDSISSNFVTSRFYNFSSGQNLKIAHGIGLCEGNLESDTCRSCLANSAMKLRQLCSNRKEAVGWYEKCMLRYSNNSIIHIPENKPDYCLRSAVANSGDHSQFNSAVEDHMAILREQAARSSSKFANDSMTFADNVKIYGLVQCTPDLTVQQCNECLDNVLGVVSRCLQGNFSGKAATPSCNIRYETAVASPHNSGINIIKIIAVTAASLAGASLVGGFCCVYCRRRKLREGREAKEMRENYQDIQLLDLTGETLADEQDVPFIPLAVIRAATQEFAQENKLGQGGFGPVYKGTLLDGKEIAVKRLSRNSGQGIKEFKTEVSLIAKLQHKNLVRLLGCCMEGKEMLLVYDYMPNGSLEATLFDSVSEARLDWKMRHRIIKGIARGLLYLHEDSRLKIIHRDLKCSNVLLDNELNPKISDFGMARMFNTNQSEAITRRVVGTFGYMAPEYAMQGTISVKSDVFSFGVLLLEIISGKKTSRFHLSEHGQSLLTFAWKLWSNNHELELMDPLLEETYVENDVLRCIHIALLCVQEDPAYRPTMSEVVFMLENDIVQLPEATEPAFFLGRRTTQPAPLRIVPKDVGSSINEITFSALSPR